MRTFLPITTTISSSRRNSDATPRELRVRLNSIPSSMRPNLFSGD
jgi:hypothetical protein